MYETVKTDLSASIEDRGDVSFSFDGKEVSVSLYETPDLTENEAIQIVEMYADQLSENISGIEKNVNKNNNIDFTYESIYFLEHNVIELPPMRFTKESSTSGKLCMEAVVIDVTPKYFAKVEEVDELRTEIDIEDISALEDQTQIVSVSSSVPLELHTNDENKLPQRPPRRKSQLSHKSFSGSDESDKNITETDVYYSEVSRHDNDMNTESFADAITSNTVTGDKPDEETLSEERLVKNVMDDKNAQMTVSGIEADEMLIIVKQLEDQVLHVRETLIHYEKLKDVIREDNNDHLHQFITMNIANPVNEICNIITHIDNNISQNTEDTTISQTKRIALLELIGEPVDELIRGVELMKQHSVSVLKYDVAFLDPLIDCVDEILANLYKYEYELTGSSQSVCPIILERTKHAIRRFGINIQTHLTELRNLSQELCSSFQKTFKVLSEYSENIKLHPISGSWSENVDAIIIESLSRPLENMEMCLGSIMNDEHEMNEKMELMLLQISELLIRLEALIISMEKYETDHHMEFVNSLKLALRMTHESLCALTKESQQVGAFQKIPYEIFNLVNEMRREIDSIVHQSEYFSNNADYISNLLYLQECLIKISNEIVHYDNETILSSFLDLEMLLENVKHFLSSENYSEQYAIKMKLEKLMKMLQIFTENLSECTNESKLSRTLEHINNILNELLSMDSTVDEHKNALESKMSREKTERIQENLKDIVRTMIIINKDITGQGAHIFEEILIRLTQLKDQLEYDVHSKDEMTASILSLEVPLNNLKTLLRVDRHEDKDLLKLIQGTGTIIR